MVVQEAAAVVGTAVVAMAVEALVAPAAVRVVEDCMAGRLVTEERTVAATAVVAMVGWDR